MLEVSLLDYKGTVNKNVNYRINEDRSGIYLNGFILSSEDIESLTEGKIKVYEKVLDFIVDDIIQYKQWNFGKVKKGAGQIGIYKIHDQKGRIYFAVIKDYVALEGDWRILLTMLNNSEFELKGQLMTDQTGFSFMEYLFGGKSS